MVIADDPIQPAACPGLLERARAGDAHAFCLLIEPWQARLLRHAAALSGDLSASEDLVSETLIAAWKSLPRYDQSCRLSTWLYAILLHRHQKSARRARSRPVALAWLPIFAREELDARQRQIPSQESSPAENAASRDAAVRLHQCIDRLPEKHRRIIRLRFFEDASLPDIARVLGCSVGTVKSRLHHALDKLRKMKMNLPTMKGDEPI